MADDSEHEEKSHDEHQTEPQLSDSSSSHDGEIPGVDGGVDAHVDSHSESHDTHPAQAQAEKKAAPIAAKGEKKKLPLKKVMLGVSSVLLLGVLALAVTLFLKGGPKKTHGPEAGAHADSHDDGHGDTHADSHVDGHGDTHAKGHDDSHGKKNAKAHGESHEVSAQLEHAGRSYPGFLEPWIGPIETAWIRIEDKAAVIRDALEENRKLRLENANLRVHAESLRLDCRVKEAASAHERNETALLGETGEKVGRTLASISYRPPRHLDGPQLNTLGLTYLQAGEHEKAAVIFTLLSQMALQSEASVKGHPLSRLRLLAGTSWYMLDHLELADQYFSEVLELPETERDLPFQAQARLWRAVASKRLGKSMKTQFWLREVLDRHPASEESKWINPSHKSAAYHQEARSAHQPSGHGEEHGRQPARNEEAHGHH